LLVARLLIGDSLMIDGFAIVDGVLGCHSLNHHKSPFVNDSTINNPQMNNVPASGRAWAMIAALGRQAS